MSTCPCCSQLPFADCCAPILAGAAAPTAEALMRSRYVAFKLQDLAHVNRTHAPEIRADFNRAEAEALAAACEWEGLQIHRARESNDTAEVEFSMSLRRDGKSIKRAGASRFRREMGSWYYVSSRALPHLAAQRSFPKMGRNDLCSCQSGRKFKKCCGLRCEASE